MAEALKGKVEGLKKRRISAVGNIEGFLKVIKQKDKGINAFLHVNEAAVDEAKEVDKKLKKGRAGRLAGLAIAVKSNISVAGLPVTCASKTLEDYYGTFDADVIRKIRAEGGIIMGMTNMDEFACGSTGENSAFGATDNPSAPGMVPGGTSSGSAAALAAGMCDLALGSDTGGSIRNPVSHCGIEGIKPSYGRVSRFGLIDSAMSFDQVGAMANDAYGCALLMEVIAGSSAYDATTVDAAVPKYTGSVVRSTTKLRLGMSGDFEKLCTDKRIYSMVSDAAKRIAAMTGSRIIGVGLKYVDLAVQAYYPIQYVEFFSGTRKFDGRRYGKRIEDSCGEEVLRRILGGMEISRAEHHGTYYRKALMAKRLIAKDFEEAFRKVDVILLPTTPSLPHKLGTRTADPRSIYAYDAFTIPANLAGICAGVVNAGKIGGVPVGLQVMAPAFNEALLIGVMSAWERLGEGEDGKA